MKIAAIDPGVSGAITFIDSRNPDKLLVEKMPESILGLKNLFVKEAPELAVIEKVGFHRPGNSAVSTAKFARNVGQIEAVLVCLGIPQDQVLPNTWMKRFLNGQVPKERADRKRAIRSRVELLRPDVNVTNDTADSAAMALWWLMTKEG
jgi:hypothetical protein